MLSLKTLSGFRIQASVRHFTKFLHGWNVSSIANSYYMKITEKFNPNWHELWKQEKWSSLVLPSSIFYNTQWAWQGVKLSRLMSILTSKKVWKFLIRNQLTKSDPKRTGGGKCLPSCQLGLNLLCFAFSKISSSILW